MRLDLRLRASLVAAVVLLTVASPSAAATADTPEEQCGLSDLPGLSAQFQRARRDTGLDPTIAAPAGSSSAHAGRIADFWQVAFTVLGMTETETVVSNGQRVGLPSLQRVPCEATVRARDHVAWSMGLAGYSAREIADVLNGHLTRTDLDEALRRSMAGQPRADVAAFLESRWREPAPSVPPVPAVATPSISANGAGGKYEGEILALARDHRVEPALIRAVIAVESAGNPRAVSRAGAIGLMQLMPRTAAALGVNPWQPSENLRGGISYLAGLLRAYGGDVRLALIAYNAGPQHADLVRSGRAVAYRETRKYIDAIGARFPIK